MARGGEWLGAEQLATDQFGRQSEVMHGGSVLAVNVEQAEGRGIQSKQASERFERMSLGLS